MKRSMAIFKFKLKDLCKETRPAGSAHGRGPMEEPAPGENKRIKFCRVFHCDSFHSQGDCVRVFVATGRLIVLVSKDILDLHSVNMTRMDKFLHPLPVTCQRSAPVMPSHEINCMVIAGSHHSQY